jgi:Cof subfamily protein (haloacid dehalogenase superfamily)
LAEDQLTGPIRLVVSDVDGTMVTTDKVLLPSTIAAAHKLREAGIHLALVSSRPPRGMMFIQEELGLTGPLGGFNGGTILGPDSSVIEENVVPEQAVRITLDLLARRGVGAWLFADNQWIIKDPQGDYVPKELRTVRFAPTVVADFEPYIARCGKVVGASAKFDILAECEEELHLLLHGMATAHRSQKYYLDLTHPDANKGTALHAIAKWYGIDPAEVACIGDMTNDVPMFHVAGLSIAMGNAPPAVAAEAMMHTESNEKDGWAEAIDRHVLPRAP